MDRLSDVRIGDITRGLGRYRPVAVTVIAIVLMAAFIPGRTRGPAGLVATAPPPAVAVASAPGGAAPPTTAPAGVAPPFAFDTGPPVFAVQPSNTFTTGSTFGGSSAGSSAPTASFAGDEFAAAPDAEFTTSPDFGAEAEKPLTITARLYASLGTGTPLATQDVPDKSSPVGNRLNQEDKRSYVRLAGTAKELVLTEAPQGRETRGPAVVRACQVLDADWAEGKGVPMATAPKFDANACVVGVRASDGVWSFDLSGFASPTDNRGIALTVGPGAGVDFQINFAEITRSGA